MTNTDDEQIPDWLKSDLGLNWDTFWAVVDQQNVLALAFSANVSKATEEQITLHLLDLEISSLVKGDQTIPFFERAKLLSDFYADGISESVATLIGYTFAGLGIPLPSQAGKFDQEIKLGKDRIDRLLLLKRKQCFTPELIYLWSELQHHSKNLDYLIDHIFPALMENKLKNHDQKLGLKIWVSLFYRSLKEGSPPVPAKNTSYHLANFITDFCGGKYTCPEPFDRDALKRWFLSAMKDSKISSAFDSSHIPSTKTYNPKNFSDFGLQEIIKKLPPYRSSDYS